MGPDVRHGRARPLIAALAGAALVAGAALTASPAVAAEGAANVDYSFDFGGPSTPVAPGFIGVHPGTTYNATQGFGFTNAPPTAGFRDRGGDDLLKRDFTIANNQAFAVDVPNGTYEVTTWAGDLIAGNGTNFDIEGTAFAGPRTSTGDCTRMPLTRPSPPVTRTFSCPSLTAMAGKTCSCTTPVLVRGPANAVPSTSKFVPLPAMRSPAQVVTS